MTRLGGTYRLRILGRRYRLGLWATAPTRLDDGRVEVTVTARFLDPLPLAPGMVTWPGRRRRRRTR